MADAFVMPHFPVTQGSQRSAAGRNDSGLVVPLAGHDPEHNYDHDRRETPAENPERLAAATAPVPKARRQLTHHPYLALRRVRVGWFLHRRMSLHRLSMNPQIASVAQGNDLAHPPQPILVRGGVTLR